MMLDAHSSGPTITAKHLFGYLPVSVREGGVVGGGGGVDSTTSQPRPTAATDHDQHHEARPFSTVVVVISQPILSCPSQPSPNPTH